jgi:ABC-type multidrug transport system fused ATPase/permease subunit
VLVFDEATRALDTESREARDDNLDQQLQGLSTVGTPREGLYYYMCRRQLAL